RLPFSSATLFRPRTRLHRRNPDARPEHLLHRRLRSAQKRKGQTVTTALDDFYVEIEQTHYDRHDRTSTAEVNVYPTADHSWHRRVEMRTRRNETLAETAPALLADLGLRATEPITPGRRFAAEKNAGTDLAKASSPTLARRRRDRCAQRHGAAESRRSPRHPAP